MISRRLPVADNWIDGDSTYGVTLVVVYREDVNPSTDNYD